MPEQRPGATESLIIWGPKFSNKSSHGSFPNRQRRRRSFPPQITPTFFTKDQAKSASLVRLLLLMAGIEPNPGPTPGNKFYCPVCKILLLKKNSSSVRCNECKQWCHFRKINNCSNLKSIKQYTPNYICPSCTNHALFTHEKTADAVKKARASKALAPDNISTLYTLNT